MKRVFACVALLATPVQAQVTCFPVGTVVQCNQITPPSQRDLGADFSQYVNTPTPEQARQQGAADGAEFGQQIRNFQERQLLSKLGKMIIAGQCPQAISLALSKGRFDLAEQAKSLCAK